MLAAKMAAYKENPVVITVGYFVDSHSDSHIDNLPRTAADTQLNGPATNCAILDERLLSFRSVDLDGENLAAVRANNFGLSNQFHLQCNSRSNL
jgi:hypothetical protein